MEALEEIGGDGRSETVLERCDRNLVELLQEVRVAQTGVQILFAFLLSVPFTTRLERLSTFQEIVYFATLLAAGAAALLLIAPTSYHRIVFRLGDKEHLVRAANRLTTLGLVFVALALVGAILHQRQAARDATSRVQTTNPSHGALRQSDGTSQLRLR